MTTTMSTHSAPFSPSPPLAVTKMVVTNIIPIAPTLASGSASLLTARSHPQYLLATPVSTTHPPKSRSEVNDIFNNALPSLRRESPTDPKEYIVLSCILELVSNVDLCSNFIRSPNLPRFAHDWQIWALLIAVSSDRKEHFSLGSWNRRRLMDSCTYMHVSNNINYQRRPLIEN